MSLPVVRPLGPLGFVALVAGGLTLALLRSAPADEFKLSGEFTDGSRATGALTGWNRNVEQAKFADRAIFDKGNPLRWWKNDALEQPAPARAFVEMFGGDRLPGRVVGIEGSPADGPPDPLQVIVEPDVSLTAPEVMQKGPLRVLTRWIRRIVWERRKSDQYVPNTAYFRDGGQSTFRSIRFNNHGVVLLTDQGRTNMAYADLAEIHMPRMNAWEAYLEQIAILAPRAEGARLVQIEAAGGVRATTSLERFELVSTLKEKQAKGLSPDSPQTWTQRLQPAWLRDPIWIKISQVQIERFFAPHEVPLSVLEPTRSVQRSVLSGSWRAQVDRNADGQSLIGGGQTFGWGWGVHAYSELSFDLPASSKSFRTRFGLDQSVGRGGCVRAGIFANEPKGSPLYLTKFVVGSSEVLDSGELPLGGPGAGQKSLVLVVDPAHDGRPSGADPFDIRDVADWFEPILTLDPKLLQIEINDRLPRAAPGWDGFTINEGDGQGLVWASRWEKFYPSSFDRYFFESRAAEGFATWSRMLHVDNDHHYLALWASRNRDPQTTPSRLQVRIDGHAVAEFLVPPRPEHAYVPPLVIPVDKYRNRDVKLEISEFADGPKSFFEFNGVALWEHPPSVLRIPMTPDRVTGDGFEFVSDDHLRGERALKVKGGSKVRIRVDSIHISGLRAPGEYRMIHFAWKKVGGKSVALNLLREPGAGDKDNASSMLSYGYGPAKKGRSKDRLQSLGDKPPVGWTEVNQETLQNNGTVPMNVEAIEFEVPDGDYALLDDIYFTRYYEDNAYLPAASQAVKGKRAAGVRRSAQRSHEYTEILAEFAPLFSLTAPPEGSWGLTLLDEFNGRKNVLKTDPIAERDTVYTALVACPAGKTTKLNLALASEPAGSWFLEVVANGEMLKRFEVDKNSTKGSWLDATVDLSKFAGKRVVLQLHQKAKGDYSSMAYWNKIEIRSE